MVLPGHMTEEIEMLTYKIMFTLNHMATEMFGPEFLAMTAFIFTI